MGFVQCSMYKSNPCFDYKSILCHRTAQALKRLFERPNLTHFVNENVRARASLGPSRGTHQLLRINKAESLTSLVRCVLAAKAVPTNANARSRSISTEHSVASSMRS